jgi:hypothetical protein
MFAMFAQLFAAFSTLFRATEKASSALNNLCEWADESSASFVDEARIKRYSSRQEMLSELGITQAEFDEKTSSVIPEKNKFKALPLSLKPSVA